jgi:4-amino-4-deoxy-L-arabinose transferase-like glycosyltransferase
MKRLQPYKPAAGVFVLALLVRILYNPTIARHYTLAYDANLYDMLGRHLVNNGCYCLYDHTPSVSRPPLWPFILAFIYALAGEHELFGRLFYCLLGSGTCVLIYFFSRDLFGKRIALVSGVIAAIYPCLFIYDGWLYTESLYTFLLTAFTYTLYRLQLHYTSFSKWPPAEKSWLKRAGQSLLHHRWSLLCGLIAGLSALARPNGVFLLGMVILWAIVIILTKVEGWKTVLKDTTLIICIAVIIILPWTYRNYQVSHGFVLVSTGVGEVLSGAYNDIVVHGDPTIRGLWRPTPGSKRHDDVNYTLKNESADTARALTWIRTHISELPYLLSLHFLNMWTPYTYSHGLAFEETIGTLKYHLMVDLIKISAPLVIFFALLGLLFTWKRYRHQLLTVYLLVALVILQNILFYGDMRFRAPIEPMLVLMAGGALYIIAQVVYKMTGFEFGRNIEKL